MKRKVFLGFLAITYIFLGLLGGAVHTQVFTKAQIAFTSARDGRLHIYVMDVDGGHVRRLTNDAGSDGFPTWSPDGKWVAFERKHVDGRGFEIYIVSAEGHDLRNFTNHPHSDYKADWSPDGRRIAFVSNRDGNSEIYVMDTDGRNPRNLTNHPVNDYFPDWFDPKFPTVVSVSSLGKKPFTWAWLKQK